MNNYTWLQKKLHKLALSSNFIREMMFDIDLLISNNQSCNDKHVFVSGLARSGTTILLNALFQSKQFASLSYEDMPFVLAPNLWSKISISSKHEGAVERAHGDGIKVATNSPEAFEEVFWMTFEDDQNDVIENFKLYVASIVGKYNKNRYLSKNNQNIRRLELINNIFPNSLILVPFRNPIQHTYSLLIQHKKFISESVDDSFISEYMSWIGHTEFGPNYKPITPSGLQFPDDLELNHWLEQWHLTYANLGHISKRIDQLYFVCYESLCSSNVTWEKISKLANLPYSRFEFHESKKIIDAEIDPEMLKKCNDIYNDMRKNSI